MKVRPVDSAHVGKDSESYEKKHMSKERQWVKKNGQRKRNKCG